MSDVVDHELLQTHVEPLFAVVDFKVQLFVVISAVGIVLIGATALQEVELKWVALGPTFEPIVS